jgi:hypothetical protein
MELAQGSTNLGRHSRFRRERELSTPRPQSPTSPIGKSNYYVGTAWRKCSTWKVLFVGRHSALLALLVHVTDGIDDEIWLIERDVL